MSEDTIHIMTPEERAVLSIQFTDEFIETLETFTEKQWLAFWDSAYPSEEVDEEYDKWDIHIYNNTDFESATTFDDGTTLRDTYDTYFYLQQYMPEQFMELNERLLANGYYGVGASETSLTNLGASERAFGAAVNQGVMTGAAPITWESSNGGRWGTLDTGLTGVDFSNVGQVAYVPKSTGASIIRTTEAQIGSMVDDAAGNVFGRKASVEERRMAISVVRALENGRKRFGAADLEESLIEAAPEEAKARDMESTLRNFSNIIRQGGA